MSGKSGEAALADHWLFVLLLALLAWVPLPWASRSMIAQAGLATASCTLLALWLMLAIAGKIGVPRGHGRSLATGMLLWAPWLLWLGFQLVPLHCVLLAELSPRALEMHRAAAQAFSENTSGCIAAPLSIAPGETALQLLLSGGYFAVYLLVILIVGTRERVKLMLWTLVLSGLFQALYGMHMSITGLEYGFFEKKTYGLGVATGTFVNRDHYAAYLELTLAAGIALVLADLGRWRLGHVADFIADLINLVFSAKFRARIAVVAMVAALVMTRSRMGNVAMFAGLASTGVLYTLLRYRRWFIPSLLLFASLLAVDLLVVSNWYGIGAVVERIEQTDLQTESRLLVLKDLEPVVADYLWTGAGMGSFAQAYAPYRDEDIRAYFDHAHNEYAEFQIETGIVGIALLGLMLFAHLWHGVRVMLNRRTPVYAAAAFASIMAMLTMMAHGWAEFMLRTPAVAATLVALMGLGMSVPSRSPRRRRSDEPGDEPAEAAA
ncbi:MAG TPA: O-antigen ligase family protein [Nevskiaceae bacterium]|nr:O-antigen ligase family protein [Nevskiaceae bacterium]